MHAFHFKQIIFPSSFFCIPNHREISNLEFSRAHFAKKRDFGHTIIRCGRFLAQILKKSCSYKRFRTVYIGDFDAPAVNMARESM